MIKTRQKLVITRIWNDLNKNWGVAVGFLLLLFLVPVLVIVTYSPNVKNITTNNADSTKPIVHISPDHGQGVNQIFIADVTSTNVDKLENVDIWFGQNSYSTNTVPGNFATISFQNFGIQNTDNNFDWRAILYSRKSNGSTNVTTSLSPDNSNSLNISTIYSQASQNKGEVTLSPIDSPTSVASIKFVKVEKKSQTSLQFYFKANFKSNFDPSNISVFMKAREAQKFGGADSSNGNDPWNQVGIWNAAIPVAKPITKLPPKFTSIPSSKAQVGTLYKYTLQAIDPQSDPLIFAVVTNPIPAFLSFNSTTLSGTPSTSDIGPHTIVVSINDSYGNIVTQSWILNVSAPSTSNQPSVTVSFSTPASGSKFSGASNDITWSLGSPVGISNVRLSYSLQTGNDFHPIKTVGSDTSKYTWDVSGIPDGQYIIKLEPLDSAGNAVNPSTSPTFSIQNTPVNSNITPPSLDSLTPQDGDTTLEKRPLISANIKKGSDDVDVTSLKIYLDDNLISNTDPNFTLATLSFTYRPSADLTTGQHVVKVFVKGKDAKTDQDALTKTWSFIINEQVPGTTNTQTTQVKPGITLPIFGRVPTWLGTLIIAIFVILLFGILIFAIIMLIRILRHTDDETTQISKYYQQENITPSIESNTQTTVTTTTKDPALDPFYGQRYNLDPNALQQPTQNNIFDTNTSTSSFDPNYALTQNSSGNVDLGPFETTTHQTTTVTQSQDIPNLNNSLSTPTPNITETTSQFQPQNIPTYPESLNQASPTFQYQAPIDSNNSVINNNPFNGFKNTSNNSSMDASSITTDTNTGVTTKTQTNSNTFNTPINSTFQPQNITSVQETPINNNPGMPATYIYGDNNAHVTTPATESPSNSFTLPNSFADIKQTQTIDNPSSQTTNTKHTTINTTSSEEPYDPFH